MNLCIGAVLSEPSLLTYTRLVNKGRHTVMQKLIPLVRLDIIQLLTIEAVDMI